ncbi:hypothetical protein JZ751_012188 [Albula glossodonta]|uniref:Uncharacterized protein n=1 Tax=Albula glossodonta TaxID=121402 RepID=A0A8T2PRU2_9TELE|nr:hypothetical protein JZ751_012188 [Albula glossodonta]
MKVNPSQISHKKGSGKRTREKEPWTYCESLEPLFVKFSLGHPGKTRVDSQWPCMCSKKQLSRRIAGEAVIFLPDDYEPWHTGVERKRGWDSWQANRSLMLRGSQG